jgi:hypothetical protein
MRRDNLLVAAVYPQNAGAPVSLINKAIYDYFTQHAIYLPLLPYVWALKK